MAALVATTSWARDAGAICGRAADASMMPPPIAVRAPINAQITLSLPSSWRTQTLCADEPSKCVAGSFELALRAAPGDRATGVAPAAIDAAVTESMLGAIATVVMKPRAPLAPRTRYEVVRSDKSGKVPLLVFGTFTTGDTTDDKAPAWSGIASHRVGSTGPTKNKGVVTIAVECAANALDVVGAVATDESAPASALRYAVWIVDEGRAIDYASTPLAILEGRVEPKRGGGAEVAVTVPLDRDGRLALPNGKKTAKVGMRAIDLAGNASASSEITVKLP